MPATPPLSANCLHGAKIVMFLKIKLYSWYYGALITLWLCCVQSIYTIRGDVWSFAVTVWEILTLGSERPLSSLSDEQVVANSALARRGAVTARPARPPTCPPEMYDLLVECWNADEHRRPTFREIDMFMRRKNMGFRPNVDVVDETSSPELIADTPSNIYHIADRS